MKLQNRLSKAAVLASAFLVIAFFSPVVRGEDYSFKVYNKTKETITKLLVSEDGRPIDISTSATVSRRARPRPSPGINQPTARPAPSGSSRAAKWRRRKPVKFDFCEKDLTLEF